MLLRKTSRSQADHSRCAGAADAGGLTRFLSCSVSTCAPEVLSAANPVSYVDPSDPPMLIIHGEADKTADPRNAKTMYELLKAKGVRTELMMLPNIGHSWIRENHQATISASRTALEKTFAFIDATIGVKKSQN